MTVENILAAADRIEARVVALQRHARELEDRLAAVPPAPDYSALEARLAALENLFPPVPTVPEVPVQLDLPLPLDPVVVPVEVAAVVDALPPVVNPDRLPPIE